MLGKYWLLDYSIHVDYNIVQNSIDEFLTFKERLYISKNLVQTILYKYYSIYSHFG